MDSYGFITLGFLVPIFLRFLDPTLLNRKYQGHEKDWNPLYKNGLQRDCDAKHGKASTKIGKTWEKIVERWTGLANHDDHSDPTKSLFGVDRGDINGDIKRQTSSWYHVFL